MEWHTYEASDVLEEGQNIVLHLTELGQPGHD